jgi:hypothetical protein
MYLDNIIKMFKIPNQEGLLFSAVLLYPMIIDYIMRIFSKTA